MQAIDFSPVEQIAKAVLYEGYLLYPYRSSSIKNQHRWMFGCLFPPSYCQAHGENERSSVQTECLLRGDHTTAVQVQVRYLQQVTPERDDETSTCRDGRLNNSQSRPGKKFPSEEMIECKVVSPLFVVDDLLAQSQQIAFQSTCRPKAHLDSVDITSGLMELSLQQFAGNLFKLRVHISNRSSMVAPIDRTRDEALRQALISCHTLLGVKNGEFVSLIDPPQSQRTLAEQCQNDGTWPVLVGNDGQRHLMLSSPIILYDYPHVAPESLGDLYDSTEIDELLSLRILTLTDEEKQEMKATDRRARHLLDRTAKLSWAQRAELHGTIRERVETNAKGLKPGARVRLKPRGSADAFDLLLKGKTGVISKIDRDFEGQVYVSVTLDDDPGQDFGKEELPGHRFFFSPDEVEVLND